MSLIKNPNEIVSTGPFCALIYGEPGTGKSTLSLSSPKPVMFDADNGMRRVQKRYQMPSLPLTTYRNVIQLLDGNELDDFDTIVVDTLGKFVECIGDYVCELDPKNRKRGGGLSQAGYGAIKVEFARITREFKKKNKNILFIAHAKAEKDGETTKMRPDCVGSSANDLVKDLDFMGYVEMHNDRRTISFTPSERFYAKNSYDLEPIIEVPNPDKVGNTFIQKFIIEKSVKRAADEADENKKYDDLVGNQKTLVEKVTDAKTADEALATINMAPVIWDSQRVAKNSLNEKVKALGLAYDKTLKTFVVAPPPKPEVQTQTEKAA